MPVSTISKIRIEPRDVLLFPVLPWAETKEPWSVTIEGYPLNGLTEELNALSSECLLECKLSIEGLTIKESLGRTLKFYLKTHEMKYPLDGMAEVSLKVLCTIA